jgi:GTP cyclohydrolase I
MLQNPLASQSGLSDRLSMRLPSPHETADPIGDDLEVSPQGFADGISTQLAKTRALYGTHAVLTDAELERIVEGAAASFGDFLTALGVDWRNDPNSIDTPRRVAKSYVFDLWKGRYRPLEKITTFPTDNYDGIVFDGWIALDSMCSHHHQAITGYVHLAYVPSKGGRVLGLSKLNRIVDHFSRRGLIQERLTVALHNAVNRTCEDNQGVAVLVDAAHNCVRCRGVRHHDARMKTHMFGGLFSEPTAPARLEFYEFIRGGK